MDVWLMWLDAIRGVITTLSSDAGLSFGLAIVVVTIVLRALLLPLAWPIAYRACIRQKKMLKLQPELKALRERFGDKPDVYLQKMTELYANHGLELVDFKGLLGGFAQLPV
ncbi:MAG TPA: YidC/Oxa1 family membrane protein insertase, partial [Gammaproteobacteria bacterium]